MPKLIECKRQDLLAALTVVMPVVERRNTIPVLSNVLICANKETITVEANDFDLMARHSGVPRTGKDKSEIVITLPAQALYDFVKTAGNDDLWIKPDFEQNIASLNAGATRSLHMINPTDFPEARKYETPVRFTMSIGEMLTAIKTVKPAISTEEARYYLNGAFFEPLGDNKLLIVATDGHRLHTINVRADGINAESKKTQVIVPLKTLWVLEKWLSGLVRILAKSKKPEPTFFIAMGSSPGGIKFQCLTVVIESKVIDGTFPDWRRVIPANNKKIAGLDSKAFLAVLKTVGTTHTNRSPAIKFSFTTDKLEMSRSDPDTGVVSDTMACAYNAEPLVIGFNGSYVRAIIEALDNSMIEIVMGDAGTPTLCRKVGVANPFCVLMPMRV